MYMNIAFDNVCFKGSRVSPSARFVYMCLCKHADNTLQTCFPSISRIAEIVGKSISTVKRAVRELCKYGAIERNPRFRKDGGQTSNLYKVAQVELSSLTKVSGNSINEETETVQMQNQQTENYQTESQVKTVNSILISEYNKENELASACTTIENGIDQENNEIDEFINTELENETSNLSNSPENEFEEIHNYMIPIKQQQNIESVSAIHRSSMDNGYIGGNLNTELRSTSKFNALNILKKSVLKFVNTIKTQMLSSKKHPFRNNELGGGHR